jgi:DNA-binding HxlR family transcriptional regulator/putative sterol carrier protein
MRSYGQYCAVARALDVVGDRWTLLIVRELLLRGAARYTDVREGLPGIATNLLADRLRELENEGVVVRRKEPPPIASTVFELTARGRELAPAIGALARWGMPYMSEGPREADEFRSRWFAWPAETFLIDAEPEGPPVTVELNAGGEPTLLEVAGGEVRARAGSVESPDATLSGSPNALLGLLTGRLDLGAACALGLELRGDESAVRRLQPLAA